VVVVVVLFGGGVVGSMGWGVSKEKEGREEGMNEVRLYEKR